MEGLLDEYRQDKEKASVRYELFKLTGISSHKQSALELYRELFRTAPNSDNREKLEELEGHPAAHEKH